MKQELEQLLSQHDAFLVEGELNKNKLAELARQYNPELLNLLMSNEKISQHFFATLETGVLVFKKDVFLQFLNNKEFLPDSFTAYKTKIGLATGDKYLSENQEVVLNFPYKDCVLEGGQTKDNAKRQEVFFNETFAPTEINRLLDDKVLTNFKRYDKDGEHEVEELADTDNLIIKGNNLIALHSLKKRFAGKIKLIYIDPPYNTGNDSFKYNDSFNHSTWLTFMKNRLEVAKKLLSDEGIIFVQIDDKEYAYLKVLMDNIFGREYCKNSIVWRKVKSGKIQSDNLPNVKEYILSYNKVKAKFNPLFLSRNNEKDSKLYRYKDEDGRVYRLSDFTQKGQGEPKYFGEKLLAPPSGKHWIWTQDRINQGLADGLIVFSKNGTPNVKRYLDDKNGIPLSDLWTDDSVQVISSTSAERIEFDGQKPEALIKRIIELSTTEGDIVLDYHLGTGTTAAVAHKMNRQYIGIEQMDYIETVSVERLKKVIAGEQGGISKDVNWTGGGSFVYAELKNDAQDFKNAIIEASTTDELLELFELAKKSSFLSYRIDPKKLKRAEFEQLSLAEQKQILSEIIDNNNLYVNYADMDDSDYGISAEDKKLNHAFYGKEK
ncbi:TPA: site-specific DNA-methyltransferase [Streptococcus equi subsp. zooepidemicus]|uniref:DNA methyltransferase n=1 Tax=Streptococcus equi TaxID=1336 RepID=UPI000DA2A983|nr:site-specific DNA-methyltransferase [Streptococcus equi]SQF82186.1 putative type III restriction/modification system modification methylase [Streptococcus equi subsp. zooepidemicus]HEL0561304.1 site-specific DNA-methyltransferase [Streptococcus equi subsp. zooepidemicus]HEL0711223.1 site-specific DNA-methyltransferase [Streptococcus equi subsp. zooepidemicus]HEL0768984.1 site-specific DNA-methyltransferase [Streptococcus equi subsp. zooepidemicus]HEL1302859.1 site-specific DNA-methyltransfe